MTTVKRAKRALSAEEFRYLAQRHQHEAKSIQTKVTADEGRVFCLQEAEDMTAHLHQMQRDAGDDTGNIEYTEVVLP